MKKVSRLLSEKEIFFSFCSVFIRGRQAAYKKEAVREGIGGRGLGEGFGVDWRERFSRTAFSALRTLMLFLLATCTPRILC